MVTEVYYVMFCIKNSVVFTVYLEAPLKEFCYNIVYGENRLHGFYVIWCYAISNLLEFIYKSEVYYKMFTEE